MPTEWVDGYRRIYPIHREPGGIGGPRGELQAYRLTVTLRGCREDGMPHGRYRGLLR